MVQTVTGGWVRYHSPLGWSILYPKELYFQSVGPAPPAVGAPGGPTFVTTVTLANFPKRPGTGADPGLGLSRSRRLPADGMVLQISGGLGGELLQISDARFPLRFADFRPAPWPNLWRQNGRPPPVSHTVNAGGQGYSIQVWLGPHAPAELRRTVARIIASMRFDPLKPGTTHGGVAVVQQASHYPVGSFTLIHVKGIVCNGQTCHRGTEPLYLVHAPGRFQYLSHAPADERCIPASSCVPYGSFYAISWKDKTGYPSACDMRIDRRDKQFYCTNMRARWDAGGHHITTPNPHDYPIGLSFDVAKIAFDGHVIIGGKFTAEISRTVVRELWPGLPPPG